MVGTRPLQTEQAWTACSHGQLVLPSKPKVPNSRVRDRASRLRLVSPSEAIELGRRHIAQAAVWALGVVLVPLGLYDRLRLKVVRNSSRLKLSSRNWALNDWLRDIVMAPPDP
jgi:hypothetical protein